MARPQQTPSQLTWPKTKLAFYIYWTIQTFIPFFISFANLIEGLIKVFKTKPPPQDEKESDPPPTTGMSLAWAVAIAQLLSSLTLLYYLVVKMRANRIRARAQSQSQSQSQSPKPRWFWLGFKSSVALEKFFMSERKGAAVLWIAAMAWVATVGITMFLVLMASMVMKNSWVFNFVLLIGGPSLIGHLVYVWGRSFKVLVMGSKKGRGVGKGEEGGDGEDGEMLLPLAGEGRV